MNIQTPSFPAKLICALAAALFASQAMAVGALAIDRHRGDKYGFAYDYTEVGPAEERALRECGRNCHVVLRFKQGCGAYAADQAGGYSVNGWAMASSGPGAQNGALTDCRAKGGKSCKVRVWGCNSH